MLSNTGQIERLEEIFAAQKKSYLQQGPPPIDARLQRIATLRDMLVRHRAIIHESVCQDFGHHSSKLVDMMDTGPVLARIGHVEQQLVNWLSVEDVVPGPAYGNSRAQVRYFPKGVCGNIAPWNFPIESALVMCVDMLAAGNRVIVKPSEIAPATSAVLARIVAESYDPDVLAVIEGGPDVAATFASMPWDHLTFTGSSRIGKLVAQAAAENLVPVTLELGGKNPALFAPDAIVPELVSLFLAFRNLKSGQVCTSPDYALVPADRMSQFVELAQSEWQKAYSASIGHPDTTGIIDERHFDRIVGYLEEAKARGVKTVSLTGEEPSRDLRQIPLTLIVDPTEDMACMQEEIFGPVIPVVGYTSDADAIAKINAGHEPLASYVATYDESFAENFVNQVRSGGSAVNNFGIQGGHVGLPFGGFGHSGHGCHSGRAGVLNYCHAKAVFFGSADSPVEAALRPPIIVG